ncbi:MAG: hypothetical protein FWE25_07110 [Lachnospiraceae bacterium]|nr:hypothetical protein [Lachnospiraceae bacterium]
MKQPLNIIIACVCGAVTSNIAVYKVQTLLDEENILAVVSHCALGDLEKKAESMDLVILMVPYNKVLTIPSMTATKLISKFGLEEIKEKLIQTCLEILGNKKCDAKENGR